MKPLPLHIPEARNWYPFLAPQPPGVELRSLSLKQQSVPARLHLRPDSDRFRTFHEPNLIRIKADPDFQLNKVQKAKNLISVKLL